MRMTLEGSLLSPFPSFLVLIIANDKKSHDLNIWFLNNSKRLQGQYVLWWTPWLRFSVRWVTNSSEEKIIFTRGTGQPYNNSRLFSSRSRPCSSLFTPIPTLSVQVFGPAKMPPQRSAFSGSVCPSSDAKFFLNLSILWACNVFPRRTLWAHFSLSNLMLN